MGKIWFEGSRGYYWTAVLILVLVDLGGKVDTMNIAKQIGAVLILVLVDLGGKVATVVGEEVKYLCLNPCFGGFGWERIQEEKPTKKEKTS